jgi:hypothetical protein
MAVYVSHDNRLLQRALVASLGIHVLLALTFPSWIPRQSLGLQPIESLSVAHVVRLEIQRPATHSPPKALPKTTRRSPTVRFARVKSELAVRSPKAPRATPVAGPVGARASAPKRVLSQQPAPLYAQASASAQPVAVVQERASATPAPAAQIAEHPVAGSNQDRGGVLPFGASQDPVLDPRTLATLQQRVTVHVTLLVTVGEDGRTKHVTFNPDLDPQTEQAIESILADADWDAAVCGGGVSCEGVATIKL